MKEAWRPLLYADEDQEAKTTCDPVAPAVRSKSAMKKENFRLNRYNLPPKFIIALGQSYH